MFHMLQTLVLELCIAIIVRLSRMIMPILTQVITPNNDTTLSLPFSTIAFYTFLQNKTMTNCPVRTKDTCEATSIFVSRLSHHVNVFCSP